MLEVRGLYATFKRATPNEVRALHNVTVTLPAGSFTAVIGTNGSGKSTFLNAVAGTVVPDAGSVRIAGRDVTAWPEHRRGSLVGRVFQNPFSGTAPTMSLAENLVLAARRGKRRGLGWALTRRVVAALRERVRALNMGLEDRLNTPIGSLSGGQRQALTLLMATWVEPELLLLDEHTAALDPKSAELLIQLTHEIVERDRLTTMMVTHSMHQAASLGDRLLMMHRGEVIADIGGAAKQRLRPEDLLSRFEEVRRSEQLDPSAAELLRRQYV
jgi:putative ABC transport system ATP-binding protein